MKYLKILMIPIVLLALVLPQVLFSVQDRYMMEKTYAGKREGADPTILNLKFVEGSAYDKLSWLAKGFDEGHEMHLLTVDGELGQEKQQEYVENVFAADTTANWIYWTVREAYDVYAAHVDNPNIFPVIYVKEKNGEIRLAFSAVLYTQTDNWKKCILVDEQELEALELWYGDVRLSERPKINMQVLADAEDGILYYVQFQKTPFSEVFSRSDLKNLEEEGVAFLLQEFYKEMDEAGEEETLAMLAESPLGAYYPKDYVLLGEPDENGLVTILNYQRWTGDIDKLHCEYYTEPGTDGQYFLRFGIRELRELLSDVAP